MTKKIPCPICEGKKEATEGRPCPQCFGRGEVSGQVFIITPKKLDWWEKFNTKQGPGVMLATNTRSEK